MRRTLALIALSTFVCMGQIAGPVSKVKSGNGYRLLVDLLAVDADTTLRFPKLTTGTNQCLPAGLPDFYQAVNYAHIRSTRGGQTLTAVIYSSMYPEGKDTVKCTANVRGVTVGGVVIDSIRILDTGTPPNTDSVLVYVTD